MTKMQFMSIKLYNLDIPEYISRLKRKESVNLPIIYITFENSIFLPCVA